MTSFRARDPKNGRGFQEKGRLKDFGQLSLAGSSDREQSAVFVDGLGRTKTT